MINQIRFLCLLMCFISSVVSAQNSFESSDLPIVVIDTEGGTIVDDPRIRCHMGIIDNTQEQFNSVYDEFNGYSGMISIEIRGSSSQSFPKKQYAFETQHEDGSNRNVPLLGMPKENDWILYAPYSDKTLIRNVLAYSMSAKLGHYAPRVRLCELILNGEYQGVYVLTEKIKQDKNRVNISKHDDSDSDVSGGYIIKLDKFTGSQDYSWNTAIGDLFVQCEYPDVDDISSDQKVYIRNYVNDFEAALFSEDFTDPELGYRQYVDFNSLIDFFIINELSKNIDAYGLSTFIYKDKGEKLTFGPVWDYNLAFGNADYRGGYLSDGFIASNHKWWKRIMQDPMFIEKLKDRWEEVRNGNLSDDRIYDMIDRYVLEMGGARERNFACWNILGHRVWPNYFLGYTYEAEIAYLKDWLRSRLRWLDAQLDLPLDQTVDNYEFHVFPNPFIHHLSVEFHLEKTSKVSLLLYDANGRLQHEVADNLVYQEGNHSFFWNGRDVFFETGNYYVLVMLVDGQRVNSIPLVKYQ